MAAPACENAERAYARRLIETLCDGMQNRKSPRRQDAKIGTDLVFWRLGVLAFRSSFSSIPVDGSELDDRAADALHAAAHELDAARSAFVPPHDDRRIVRCDDHGSAAVVGTA